MERLVQELEIEADYGQIYIYDPATQLPDQDVTEGDDPLQRAMEDGYESRRFVGYAGGLIDVITPSQYNWKALMRIEVSQVPPESDAESWDHMVAAGSVGNACVPGLGWCSAGRDAHPDRQLSRPLLGTWVHSRRRGDRGT